MQNEIPIIQKMYDFYREFYQSRSQMPKQDRHAIGQKIENKTLDLLADLIHASRTDRKSKPEYLEEAAVKLDALKLFLRLAEDVKAISTKKYLSLSEKLQEIGKMLGGWLRSLN